MPRIDHSKTADPLTPPEPARASQGPELRPQIEVLFHPELGRVGQALVGWEEAPGQGMVVGRHAPLFGGERGPQPLQDRFISRSQCRLRWLAGEQLFEVHPSPEARQGVSVGSLEDLALRPVSGPTRVPPETALAIGRRVLLLLRVAPAEVAEERHGLIGESSAMHSLRAYIKTVAAFRENVLILGETGTGKELVARAIHAQSGAPGEFVALNMGGLDPGLAGSEIFGHVRGAFTGALGARVGAIEAAREGTLFLDEIGDLAPELQKKLLRVLEERNFSPLGSHQSQPLGCRIIAATHCPLREDVERGSFRRDLYERLRALTVPVPPLRKRRGDVLRLFLRQLSELSGRHPGFEALWREGAERESPINFDMAIKLLKQPWPGNIRQLRNLATATAAASLARGQFALAEIDEGEAKTKEEPRARGEAQIPSVEAIKGALGATRGNVRAAADRLGCSRHQLYRWMEARGLDVAAFRRPDDADG